MKSKKSFALGHLKCGHTLVFDSRRIFFDPCTLKYVVSDGRKCRYYSHYYHIMPYIYKHWFEMSF